jgi:hypothetical protein
MLSAPENFLPRFRPWSNSGGPIIAPEASVLKAIFIVEGVLSRIVPVEHEWTPEPLLNFTGAILV